MTQAHCSTNRIGGNTTSTVYRDAEIDARGYSRDVLLACRDVFSTDAADDDPLWPGETGRHLARERLRAVEAELTRRDRISALPASKAAKAVKEYEQWAELARTVRETVSVPDVLRLIGCLVTPSGTSRQSPKYHSDCPVCRDGTDRLVSWGGPNGRCWCRKCGWSADVIAVAQTFLPDCEHFRDALKFLARLAALEQEARS